MEFLFPLHREIKGKMNMSIVPITAKKVQFGQQFLHKLTLQNTFFRREHNLCSEEKTFPTSNKISRLLLKCYQISDNCEVFSR